MIIARRIPMNAFQTGLYQLLTAGQTTPVYDDVPERARPPYITLGEFACKRVKEKTGDIWEVSQKVSIWSSYAGKAEVNEIANDIATVISSAGIDLSASHFRVMSQEVDSVEAFPEETYGFYGEVTIEAQIQNLGG